MGKMDYHHLESLDAASFDGVYTMEILVHAADPDAVLAGFYRVLRPSSRLSLFEHDHEFLDDAPRDMAASMRKINDFATMPTNAVSHPGVFKRMLEDNGFTDVVIRDYSENIKPMTRLFYLVGYILCWPSSSLGSSGILSIPWQGWSHTVGMDTGGTSPYLPRNQDLPSRPGNPVELTPSSRLVSTCSQ